MERPASPLHREEMHMRINVSALVADGTVGKFLIVVPKNSTMLQLIDQIRENLTQSNIKYPVRKVLNSMHCALPENVNINLVLRDSEEVYVILEGVSDSQFNHFVSRGSLNHTITTYPETRCAASACSSSVVSSCSASSETEDDRRYHRRRASSCYRRPKKHRHHKHRHHSIHSHGHSVHSHSKKKEITTVVQEPAEDVGSRQAVARQLDVEPTMHVPDPGTRGLTTYDTQWLVDCLTPKLRDWVCSRFHAANVDQPSYIPAIDKFVGARFFERCGSFISLLMHPPSISDGDATTSMPAIYWVARVDVIEFERMARAQVQASQVHCQHLEDCSEKLKRMVVEGALGDTQVSVVLPYHFKYIKDTEMVQLQEPVFSQLEGSRPVIVVDVSGKVARNLSFIQAALKRVLYSYLVNKQTFNLIMANGASGETRSFGNSSQCPSQRVLREAEAWIDALSPHPKTRTGLMNGILEALQSEDADVVYVLSSGLTDPKRQNSSVTSNILQQVRSNNMACVKIHTIGVDCLPQQELFLRKLAEENRGAFRSKRFSEPTAQPGKAEFPYSGWRTNLVRKGRVGPTHTMTVAAQMKIVSVMLEENHVKAAEWTEERDCANRLLLASTSDAAKMRPPPTHSIHARTGGGYHYHTPKNVGLEGLFTHPTMLRNSGNEAFGAASGPVKPQVLVEIHGPPRQRRSIPLPAKKSNHNCSKLGRSLNIWRPTGKALSNGNAKPNSSFARQANDGRCCRGSPQV
eukprot:Platyproteum_vivax@DN5627_c0_g1_i2.p1